MTPFDVWSGPAAPMLADDINTDQIAPVAGVLSPDYGAQLFARQRRNPDGAENPDFVLNQPQFRNARILVTGQNFGCGSSREAAVWGLVEYGIRCLIGRGFADIFRENCLQNGMLTVTLGQDDAFEREVLSVNGAAPFSADLRTQEITCPSGRIIHFDIPPAERTRLLEGLDEIGLTLKYAESISNWEKRMAADQPWLQKTRDRRLAG
jgi:3-isopropylmalate dehydratase small subunit